MKSRMRLLQALAIGCVLALLSGWLMRRDDPYAALRRLGATERLGNVTISKITTGPSGRREVSENLTVKSFYLRVPIPRVEAILPRHTHTSGIAESFTLLSGDEARLATPGEGSPDVS